MFESCKKAKKINPKLFICIIDIEASESAVFRTKCFNYGANMVTNDHHSLKQVLNIIGNKGFNGPGDYICPYCQMNDLTEDELWHHVPLYHVNDAQPGTIKCPICDEEKRRNYLLHLRNHHGPVIRGEIPPEYRDGILTHAFALVVVRRPTDNKFLVVQEASNSGFWLPGGRVEVGETLLEAAIRETKEEAGIDVDIKGVLKVEHSTYAFDDRKKAYNRMRVIFYAEPMDEKELPKSVPNYDSAGATFISVDELDDIELRADEPREWFNSLTQNFYYHSLDILSCWKHDHRSPDHPKKYYYAADNNPSTHPSNQYNEISNTSSERTKERERDSRNGHNGGHNRAGHQQQTSTQTIQTPESDFTESESYSSPYSRIPEPETKKDKESDIEEEEDDHHRHTHHQIPDHDDTDESDPDPELENEEQLILQKKHSNKQRRKTEKHISSSSKKKEKPRKVSEPSPYRASHRQSAKFHIAPRPPPQHLNKSSSSNTNNKPKSNNSTNSNKKKKSGNKNKSKDQSNNNDTKNNDKNSNENSNNNNNNNQKEGKISSKTKNAGNIGGKQSIKIHSGSQKQKISPKQQENNKPQIQNVKSNQSNGPPPPQINNNQQLQPQPQMQPQPQQQVYIYYTQHPQFGYTQAIQAPNGYAQIPMNANMANIYGQRQSLQFPSG
eukprot:550292_1